MSGSDPALERVYLDHNATSPLDERVADAMSVWWRQGGNPSSLHAVGRTAREVLENAREQVADFLGADHSSEVVFGASGTELNNAVLETAARTAGALERDPAHVIAASFEHPSVIAACERLERRGIEVTQVPPNAEGVVTVDAIEAALRPSTRLVALMLANNELGTIQPVGEVARLCRGRGVSTLCDAVQAAGKVPVNVEALGVDYLVIAAHKFSGPIGAAAVWVRPGADFEPLLVGGSQERRRRASTENVPANAGLGLACVLAQEEAAARLSHLEALRDQFETGVTALHGVAIHCASSERLPNTSNVRFEGISAQDLLIRLDLEGFCVSTGSACASGSVEPSPTLLALGLDPVEALSALRVSFWHDQLFCPGDSVPRGSRAPGQGNCERNRSAGFHVLPLSLLPHSRVFSAVSRPPHGLKASLRRPFDEFIVKSAIVSGR